MGASAIPLIGNEVVFWLWGGFSVANATLTRFFTLHFLLPFLLAALRAVHLLFLHQRGSSDPLGVSRNLDKSPFHPYFSVKDLFGFVVFFLLMRVICFLFAYAILRSIPRKLGGVLALVLSVLILAVIPFYGRIQFKSRAFLPLSKLSFWLFVNTVILLT